MAEVSLLIESVDNATDGGGNGSKGLGGCRVKVCREVRKSLESGLDRGVRTRRALSSGDHGQ